MLKGTDIPKLALVLVVGPNTQRGKNIVRRRDYGEGRHQEKASTQTPNPEDWNFRFYPRCAIREEDGWSGNIVGLGMQRHIAIRIPLKLYILRSGSRT